LAFAFKVVPHISFDGLSYFFEKFQRVGD